MKILELLLLVLTDARILGKQTYKPNRGVWKFQGLYNGSLLVEKAFPEDTVYRRRFFVEFEDDAVYNVTVDTAAPFKLIIGLDNYIFNSFDDSSISVKVGKQVKNKN